MKINKKNPRKQLEKFSSIFLQLGLVLTLFVVFITIEHQSEKEELAEHIPKSEGEEPYMLDENRPIIFVKDVPKPKVNPRIKTPVTQVTPVKNNEPIINNVIIKPTDEPTKPQLTSDKIKEIDIPEDINPDDGPKLIMNVQEIPIYRGCENLSREESIKCLDSRLKRLIKRNFDVDLANELNLKSGKHRITTQFVIDESGNVVDIKIRAPHPMLKKETQKIVNKIPKFTPGKQNGKFVKVRYTLPITFRVE